MKSTDKKSITVNLFSGNSVALGGKALPVWAIVILALVVLFERPDMFANLVSLLISINQSN